MIRREDRGAPTEQVNPKPAERIKKKNVRKKLVPRNWKYRWVYSHWNDHGIFYKAERITVSAQRDFEFVGCEG